MKKTSIVFLVISVLLVFGGIWLIGKGEDMAAAEGIDLFKQELTETGDLIETIEYSSEDINKFYIEFDDVDVNVIGNSEKSYIEIINFNAIEYSAYPNNHTFNIKSDLISSLTGRAEGGKFSFNGVRDYVRFEKYNKDKKINIYVTPECSLKSINIVVKKGDLSFDNINLLCDYNINIGDGNVTLSNTPETSLFMCILKNGNISLNDCFINRVNLNIENGNVAFSTPSAYIYDYAVEVEAGNIVFNEETHKGVFSVYNDECNGDFQAHIGVGNVTIQTKEKQPEVTETPEETQNEETQPEETLNA